MNDLTILIDYRGAFYSSVSNARTFCSMDLSRLCERFRNIGWNVKVIKFPEVDFQKDWSNDVVLYQSAEDPGLEYKSYVEDIILGLSLAGAKLTPGFPYLRAHHNKVFLEILRKTSHLPEANSLSSYILGVYEDFSPSDVPFPVVAKVAESSGSRGVVLLKTPAEAAANLPHMMRSPLNDKTLRELVKRVVRKGYVPYSLHRRKIILQEYIPDLAHDYKILVYGDHVYVLRRRVREKDFRASGSGKFSWPRELPDGLLNFAWKIFQGFDVPHASFDIAESKGSFHLLEAQFVDFGPLTLERSTYFWTRQANDWAFVEAPSELETTLAQGVTQYAIKKGWFHNFRNEQVIP